MPLPPGGRTRLRKHICRNGEHIRLEAGEDTFSLDRAISSNSLTFTRDERGERISAKNLEDTYECLVHRMIF